MQIKIETNKSFEAFVNVVGNSQTTSVEEHNKNVLAFVELVNSNSVSIHAFTGSDGKIVIGFK